jgi:hemoglobin-like flavoprotein
MTDKKIEQGGPEWERNEAAKRIAAAIAAGDAAALEVAADRLGDAVVNASTSRLIQTLIQTIKVEIKPEITGLSTDVRVANQRAGAIYSWLEREFATNAEWRDKYSEEIDRQGEQQRDILAAVQDGAARLGKIETEQARQAAIIASRPAERQAEHQAIVEEVAAPLQAVMERLNAKRKELDDIHAWQAAIDKRLAELERGGGDV